MGRNHKNRIVSEVDPTYEKKDWRQKIFRGAAYIRVSTDSSDQENSFDNQKQHYDTMIPQNPNWEYVGLYADDGISGTSIRNRTDFNRMVKDCTEGKIDLIIVKDVSRFARNLVDCLNTVELLLKLDPPVGIFFETNNINTLDAGNKMFLMILAMFAEFDSDLKSSNVRFGNRECFEKGNYFCPNLLGFERDGKYDMKIEPEGAKTVRLIYDLFLAGYPKREIAEIITSLSLPTAKGNLEWSTNSIAGILKNEKYSGDFIMQKTFSENFKTQKAIRNRGQKKLYYEPDHHDGIVTQDEHARALMLLKSNQSSPYFNNEYVIRIIRKGLMSGFIPMNLAFGGYSAANYLAALETAKIPRTHIETEVAHITGSKRVRRELFCDRNTAAVTISPHGLLFNAGCIALLDDADFAEVLLHPAERLFAVRRAYKRNKNAIPWNTKALPAKELTGIIYSLMGWKKDWRYKATANCFAKNGERVIFFDLGCCEFRFKDEGRTTRAIPSDWISEFGEHLPKHMMQCRRALADALPDWKTDITPASIGGFTLGIKPLSRNDSEKRIAQMRKVNG
jgi:DNA invertase Pin-like site-specific DNA recombinase